MRGVVKDAQGVIPGVEVTLVNEDTNAARIGRRRTRSASTSFASVLPGTYTVRVALAGLQDRGAQGPAHRHAADR